MTNFFGINVTGNRRNNEFDSNKFVTKRLTDDECNEIRRFTDEDEDLNNKRDLPLLLIIIKSICGMVWVFTLWAIAQNWISGMSFIQGYRLFSGLYWIGLACFIAWLALLYFGKERKKGTENSVEFKQHIEAADTLVLNHKQSLGVPEDAEYIDVLAERYVIKNGVPKHRDFLWAAFFNFDMSVFVSGENLCFADLVQRWEIPLSSFRSVTLMKKRASFPEWNKSEPITSEKYKQYIVPARNLGYYLARYYRVEIIDPKGEFYLLIPEYDGEVFMELTKLHANDG